MPTARLRQSNSATYLWLTRLLLLYTVISSAYLLYLTWPFTTDDAYITIRYALHLYQGHGLYWNVGGLRVEGYTNFLYVVFSYLALCLHLSPILFLKWLNIASFYLTLGTLYLLARYWLEPIIAALCTLVFSYQIGVIWWTVSGLETITYTFFILAAVYCFFKSIDENNQCFCNLAALFTLLASLTRSDGVIVFFALFGGYAFLFLKHKNVKHLKAALWFCFIFLIPYGIYFIWRWHYFGRLLPNSAYCKEFSKADNYLGPPYKVGMRFLQQIFTYGAFAIIAGCLRFNYRVFVILLLVIASALIYMKTDSVIAYHIRYFIPVIGFIFILAAYGIRLILKKINQHTPSIPVQFFFFASISAIAFIFIFKHPNGFLIREILFFILFFAILLTSLSTLQRHTHSKTVRLAKYCLASIAALVLIFGTQYILRYYLPYKAKRYQNKMELRVKLAQYIKENTTANEAIFFGDVGLVGYLTERPIADAYCINNPVLTNNTMRGSMLKYFPYLFHHVNPKLIVLMRYTYQKLPDMHYFNVYRILNEPYFKTNYRQVKLFSEPKKTSTAYVVFMRKH